MFKFIILCKYCYCENITFYEKAVLIDQNSILLFSKEQFSLVNLKTQEYSILEYDINHLKTFESSLDFVWVPYSSIDKNELHFSYQYGKICISSVSIKFPYFIQKKSKFLFLRVKKMKCSRLNLYLKM